MLKILLTLIHIGVSIFLILVVLLQTGKRADLAGAFGGGGSQTAFGARGAATLLSKLTTTFAVVFMLTSLGLAVLSTSREPTGSVLDSNPAAEAPAQPEPTEPAGLPALPPETTEPSATETEESSAE